jgi:DivIVA domain-containing protein
MNGNEVRDFGFGSGGYAASQVDDLLRRIAVELDAGRPVGPPIANATFQRALSLSRGYDVDSVDWYLDQLRYREDRADLAGTGADPWRDLPVAKHFARSGPGLNQECAAEWSDFGQVPGTHLWWVRTRARRRELQTAEQNTIASGDGWLDSFRINGRTFTAKQVNESSWPGVTESAAHHIRDQDGHYLDLDSTLSSKLQAKADSQGPRRSNRFKATEVCDEEGTPVLYTTGMHYADSARGCITFPDRRWLRFPVRGTDTRNAIMTAVDQGGNKAARYRITRQSFLVARQKQIEITVHPDWKLTDELVLAILISAPWISLYFASG